jgi:hypothetical protein
MLFFSFFLLCIISIVLLLFSYLALFMPSSALFNSSRRPTNQPIISHWYGTAAREYHLLPSSQNHSGIVDAYKNDKPISP